MKKMLLGLVALIALVATPTLRAQDLTGNWQGTLKPARTFGLS
jgi:hypothetical protein